MNSYTSLRSRVSDIIDQIANGANNDDVIASTGRQWYNDERDFQSQIDSLPANLKTNPQYVLIKGNLGEVEAFLYPAGTDAMASCDPRSARKELEVADYFYHAVQKEMATGVVTADDASDPPQVDASEHSCATP